MKLFIKILFLNLLLIFFISSCEKNKIVETVEMSEEDPTQGEEEEEVIDSNSVEETFIMETYIGETYQVWQMSNSTDGLSVRDTTYNDTYYVTYIDQDSIIFNHLNFEVLFEANPEHIYFDVHSTHSNTTYELKNQDSLLISYWLWGGGGGNFNQENRYFKGVKQ